MSKEIPNDLRSLSEIRGIFKIPVYQRGYRWGNSQINTFLNDIDKACAAGEKQYFLQAIVVKQTGTEKDQRVWELIDGQQRLTTAWLMDGILKRRYPESQTLDYSIQYDSRPQSREFLEEVVAGEATAAQDENIDYWYMSNAASEIRSWLKEHKKPSILYDYFRENVKILWYEDSADIDAARHFVSLNSGKIPLEDAELCRALLLTGKNIDVSSAMPPALEDPDMSSAAQIYRRNLIKTRQLMIGNAWDQVERQLRESSFTAVRLRA